MAHRQSTTLIAIGVIAGTLVGASSPASAVPAPWQRSETREPCANVTTPRHGYPPSGPRRSCSVGDMGVFVTRTAVFEIPADSEGASR